MFIKFDGSNVSGICKQGEFAGVVVFHNFAESGGGESVSATRVAIEGQDESSPDVVVTPKEIREVDDAMSECMEKVLEKKKIAEVMVSHASKAKVTLMPAVRSASEVMKLGELRPKVRPTSASSRRSNMSDKSVEIEPVEGRQVRSVTYTAGETKEEGDVELVKYIGEVDENGMRHGIGTLWFRDGSMYEGEFERDRPHGVGIET